MKRLLFLLLVLIASSSIAQTIDGALKTVTASGTNVYTITEAFPAIYTTNERFIVHFTNGNTGASTLNRNGLGARSIVKADGSALENGDLAAGGRYLLSYNGASYKIVGSVGGAITDAAADGTTKGIATFTANDFNASSGVISIDYTNAQAASASNKGFLTSADWSSLMVGIITSASVSTSGGTITLDFQTSSVNRAQKVFNGSATFSAPKTIALSNTGNAISFVFNFVITSDAAVLTLPSDFQLFSIDWDGTDWTPAPGAIGAYSMGGTFNSVSSKWEINISGPHVD